MVLLSFFKVWAWCMGVRTYGCTDSHVTTKVIEIDGLPNFLRYGALLTRLQHTGGRNMLEEKSTKCQGLI